MGPLDRSRRNSATTTGFRLNKARDICHVKDWEVIEKDVTQFDYAAFKSIDFIAGGVPCQPFSLGGKHRADKDHRDMFPEFARAVAALRPRAFMVENVKGLLRSTFTDYFEYIKLRLSHPLVAIKPGQSWRDHRVDLEKAHTSGGGTGLEYNVVCELLNAADYGRIARAIVAAPVNSTFCCTTFSNRSRLDSRSPKSNFAETMSATFHLAAR